MGFYGALYHLIRKKNSATQIIIKIQVFLKERTTVYVFALFTPHDFEDYGIF